MNWMLYATLHHAAWAESVYRTAVFVSSNDGGDVRTPLRYADSDAKSLYDVLEELGGFEDSALVAHASAANLRTALGDLDHRVKQAESQGRRTEVVFYYSGHSDEDGLLLGTERVGYDELRTSLSAVPADVRVAILDSCASGALIRTKGGVARAPFLVDQSVDVSGTAVLTSSSADEAAQESDRIGGSYFTHALVSGLRGAADGSNDGRVSLTEAYHFAYGETLIRTERTAAGAQHAAYDLELSGTGDLVLTDLDRTDSALDIDAGIHGRVFIRDTNGVLVAELGKAEGRSVLLALPAGDYTALVDDDGDLQECSITLASGQTLALSEQSFTPASQEMARLRGGTKPVRDEPFSIGILPSFHEHDDIVVQHAAISLGVNASDRLEGAQIALGGNYVGGDVKGTQIAVGANLADGPMHGLQASVGTNAARSVTGPGQWSVGANVADGPVRGSQIAVGGNFAHGDMKGMQAAVGANITTGRVDGLQAAVGPNIAQDLVGAQLGVGPNVAREIVGPQIALVNVGSVVRGAQIGLVNVAGNISGTQIGLVNVAGHIHGAPIGLVSVAGNGYNHAWLEGNDVSPISLALTYGGENFYTYLEGGARPSRELWTAGLGFGWHAPAGQHLFVDTDLGAFAGWDDSFQFYENFMLARARVQLGYQVTPWLAAVGGPTLWMETLGGGPSGGALPGNHGCPTCTWESPSGVTELPTHGVGGLPLWPGIVVGLRFG